MSASILQTICAFCFSKCLTYMSTQGEARASDHDHLWICSASEKLSWPGPDNPYKAHLFLFRKSGLRVADQLPPIFSSTQYPLSVIHTHSLGWARIYVPDVRAPFLVLSSLLSILETSPAMTFLLTSQTRSRPQPLLQDNWRLGRIKWGEEKIFWSKSKWLERNNKTDFD